MVSVSGYLEYKLASDNTTTSLAKTVDHSPHRRRTLHCSPPIVECHSCHNVHDRLYTVMYILQYSVYSYTLDPSVSCVMCHYKCPLSHDNSKNLTLEKISSW